MVIVAFFFLLSLFVSCAEQDGGFVMKDVAC